MNVIKRIRLNLKALYNFYIKGRRNYYSSPYYLWRLNDGDNTLRFDYNLTSDSIVFDVGGFRGDFASEIRQKFKSEVYIFEPMPEYFKYCQKRFRNDLGVTCFQFGLGGQDIEIDMYLDEQASGNLNPRSLTKQKIPVKIKAFNEIFRQINKSPIDLLKINIEGGEYELLEHLIETKLIEKIKNLQIQFHDFVPNATLRRQQIRSLLSKTHSEDWCYPFIWESWKSRSF